MAVRVSESWMKGKGIGMSRLEIGISRIFSKVYEVYLCAMTPFVIESSLLSRLPKYWIFFLLVLNVFFE